MRRFLSVTRPKVLEKNSYLKNHWIFRHQNLVRYTRFFAQSGKNITKVIGQRSRSPYAKNCCFDGMCIIDVVSCHKLNCTIYCAIHYNFNKWQLTTKKMNTHLNAAMTHHAKYGPLL